MNKKAEIFTYLSFKHYLLWKILGIIVIFTYLSFTFGYWKFPSLTISCQENIIPERMLISCSNGANCHTIGGNWGSLWDDGTPVGLVGGATWDGKDRPHMGSFEGENKNYFYAYGLSYENTPISSDGTIGKTKKYTIDLILDPKDYTNSTEGYAFYIQQIDAKVISFKCH